MVHLSVILPPLLATRVQVGVVGVASIRPHAPPVPDMWQPGQRLAQLGADAAPPNPESASPGGGSVQLLAEQLPGTPGTPPLPEVETGDQGTQHRG